MKIDSARIKELRKAKGWSQEQLSEASGLSPRTIQRIEGEGNASMESIRILAEEFDIDPKKLEFREMDSPPNPIDAWKKGFFEFANYSDKATRFEYWWFLLFIVLLTAVATLIHETAYLIVMIICLLPLISASIRRLNDVRRSSWWLLLFLVPFGQVVVFYLLAQESSPIDSRIGTQQLDVA